MNQLKLSGFIHLLECAAAGDPIAADEPQALEVTLEDGFCFYNLHREWRGAFSFQPGRKAALAPILSLARKLLLGKTDDTLWLFDQPEWRQLAELRGPVETVMIQACSHCHARFPRMGMSGFLDAAGLVCGDCGSVYFKSYYDDTPLPACSCGGAYPPPDRRGCPKCGSPDSRTVRNSSPYEYFATHAYLRGPLV